MTRLIKTEEELKLIREGGHKLGLILATLARMVKPGLTTAELEDEALRLIEKAGGKPAFKGYHSEPDGIPFPTALCISINDEIVHGPALPSRVLNEGDIVSLDIGMEYPSKGIGYFTDTATTVAVGKISKELQHLLHITQEALQAGIDQVKAGNHLNDIGKAIEKVVKKEKLGLVRDLVGHGVGLAVHEEPQVPNYEIKGRDFPNKKLEKGMVIAIEPMVTTGDWRIEVAEDGFTFVTVDGSMSAHFEHTIEVTEDGYRIITQ